MLQIFKRIVESPKENTLCWQIQTNHGTISHLNFKPTRLCKRWYLTTNMLVILLQLVKKNTWNFCSHTGDCQWGESQTSDRDGLG